MGYEYPIYLTKAAPCHDIYDSQGTIVVSMVKITIDYRGVGFFPDTDYGGTKFSDLVLASNVPIDGPADLRKFEIASFEIPKGEIELELSKDIPKGPKLDPHRALAAALGIEPAWFDRVDSLWEETKVEDNNPNTNLDFRDGIEDIFELQELENEELEDELPGPESLDPGETDVESVLGSTEVESLVGAEAPTITDTVVSDESSVVEAHSEIAHEGHLIKGLADAYPSSERNDPPDIEHLNRVFSSLTVESRTKLRTILLSKSEGTAAPDIHGTDSVMLTEENLGMGPPEVPPLPDGCTQSGNGGKRNPAKPERRKSFEKAASKLAAIPRTKSGKERMRPLSHSEDHGK